MEGMCAKYLKATLLLVDFSKVFISIKREKIEQILIAYSHRKESVTFLLILYKKAQKKWFAYPIATDFFNMFAGVSQRDILASYMVRICLDYVLQMVKDLIKENCFTLKKIRCWWYCAETITDTNKALASMGTQSKRFICFK